MFAAGDSDAEERRKTMENMSYILFICVVAPICSMLFISEARIRRSVGFFLLGMCICLFVSEVNGLLAQKLDVDEFYLTTSVTPITEELLKAFPLLFFAVVFSDKAEDLVPLAFFIGIGFAVLENLILLTQNLESVTLVWAVIRGFSSGLMHGICTVMVGICISFVRKKKKLFYCGILAQFDAAIVFHAIFNALVQARNVVLNYAGFALPILAYICILLVMRKVHGKKEATEKAVTSAKRN